MTTDTGRKVSILSLDGGGSKGILSALYLAALEKEIRHQSGDPDLYLSDCFDLIAGSSTGGILAAFLRVPSATDIRRPQYSAREVCNLFMQYIPQAFTNINDKGGTGMLTEKYNGRSLAMLLRMAFTVRCMGQMVRPCLITAYDIAEQDAVFFCSHDYYSSTKLKQLDMKPIREQKPDWLVRDVCTATAAAPVFFQPAVIHPLSRPEHHRTLIDGATFANNPSVCAYAEVRAKWNGTLTSRDMFMVSLGTGLSKESIPSGGYLTGWKGGIKLIDLLMHAGTEAVHFAIRRIFSPHQKSYYRINWQLPEVHPLDAVTRPRLNRLLQVFTGRDKPPGGKSDWMSMAADTADHILPRDKKRLETVAEQLLRHRKAS